jgi:SAM-dependent methyltransferase
MASRYITRQLNLMRHDWERRAHENARHYVLTGQKEWSDAEFYRAGEVTMQEDILNDLSNICQGRDPKEMSVLEIGCGAGRVTRAFAGYFGQVYAVDISREMVRQARRATVGFSDTHIFRNNGHDLSVVRPGWWQRLSGAGKLELDFAFSMMVFQHIPSRAIIENYVREVSRLLRPGSLFKFQVQGYPQEETRQEDSWLGVSYTEDEARRMAERCGFELRYDYGAGSQYYWLWYFKR